MLGIWSPQPLTTRLSVASVHSRIFYTEFEMGGIACSRVKPWLPGLLGKRARFGQKQDSICRLGIWVRLSGVGCHIRFVPTRYRIHGWPCDASTWSRYAGRYLGIILKSLMGCR
jgi:hypothetical protein